jgi:cleavage and polyadenylation specificity factor subunit 1
MLEGRQFTLYTDHKPLTFALSKAAEPWTARQCRHLSYVAEFTGDIRHIAGQDNVVADTLSRPPQAGATVAATPQTLDYAAIAEAQRDCPSIQAAGDSSLSLQLVPFGTVRVLCDNKGRHPRPVIPLGHRRQVFDAYSKNSLSRSAVSSSLAIIIMKSNRHCRLPNKDQCTGKARATAGNKN